MSKGSLIANDRRVLFREVFTPQSVSRNSGVITGGVTLNPDGTATFDGTTGYIDYHPLNNGKYTFRLRFRTTDTGPKELINFYGSSAFGLVLDRDAYWGSLLQLNATNYRYWWANTSLYCDGEWHTLEVYIPGKNQTDINSSTLKIDGQLQTVSTTNATSAQVPWNILRLGKVHILNFDGDMDLFEVWPEVELTTEESQLLFSNRLYKGPVR